MPHFPSDARKSKSFKPATGGSVASVLQDVGSGEDRGGRETGKGGVVPEEISPQGVGAGDDRGVAQCGEASVETSPQDARCREDREVGVTGGGVVLSEEEGENPLDSSLEEPEVSEGSPIPAPLVTGIAAADKDRERGYYSIFNKPH